MRSASISVALLVLLLVVQSFSSGNVIQTYSDSGTFFAAELAAHPNDYWVDYIDNKPETLEPPPYAFYQNGYAITWTDASDASIPAIVSCPEGPYGDLMSAGDGQIIKISFSRKLTAFGLFLGSTNGVCSSSAWTFGSILITLSSGETYTIHTGSGSGYGGLTFVGFSVTTAISWVTFKPIGTTRVIIDDFFGYGPSNVIKTYLDPDLFNSETGRLSHLSDYYFDGVEGALGDRVAPYVFTQGPYIITSTDASNPNNQAITFCDIGGYGGIYSSQDNQVIKLTFTGVKLTIFGIFIATSNSKCGAFVGANALITLSSGETYTVRTGQGSGFGGEQWFAVTVHTAIEWVTIQPIGASRIVLDVNLGYGTPVPATCKWPMKDCNADGTCETDIRTISNCGYCGNDCDAKPHAISGHCSKSFCYMDSCEANYADCNKLGHDGCEIDLRKNHNHCGACGNACAKGEMCKNGVCHLDCAKNHANCDGDASNFCEVDLHTDWRNCNSCGMACSLPNAVSKCQDGNCKVRICYNGFCNNDGNDANGCEATC